MAYADKAKSDAQRPASVAVRYGVAFVSVAAARVLTQVFIHFHLPQPFTALALSAIAITFWYGGTMPGILAAILSSIVRSYFFEPDTSIVARALYDLVFLIFAILMARVTQTRNELELKVAERTAELTRSNEELKVEITGRKRVEETLRRSEGYLAEAQKLSHTGSWASIPVIGEIKYLSEECYRVLGFDPHGAQPRYETFFQRIHPDDQAKVKDAVQAAGREKAEFELDYRIIHPDGKIRDLHAIGHPVLSRSGEFVEFVGTVMDVTERKQAEEEREKLRQAYADLAHVNRVTTLGELTASLAHEVNQPIAASVTNANTCLRWLTRDRPDLEEARAAALRIVKDGTRAAEIVNRMRLLFKKGTPQWESVNVNEVIQEMIALLYREAEKYSISFRTHLAADIPQIMADRVQLQQVLMNLILNGIEAMKDVDGERELAIKSERPQNEHLLVSVRDTGVGLPPQQADQIFDAFFTTKPQGTGMGLRISRSIVESHGGRLWCADNAPRGANFYFTLPTQTEADG
jgi:PAS domain S-box-containing protein